MALEKRKNKYIPTIKEINIIKGRHSKNPTVCADQRRQSNHCGICGYGDIAFQGVDHCTVCGKEKEVLYLVDWWTGPPTMKCHTKMDSYRKRNRIFDRKETAVERYGIRVCLACGAVKAPKCPNCGFPLWKKGLQRYCKRCGFRV